MKKLTVLLLALVCLLVLAGCGCEHEWVEADCVNPKHCSLCSQTEGDPLGHVWLAATCETPKTCEVCGEPNGDPKGHSWVEANCEEPKHCENCTVTEGEALGHDWQDATTELPQTCAVCAATEGERIITDPRFTTAQALPLMGKWSCVIPVTGEMMEIPDFPATLDCSLILNFGNAGDLTFSMELANEEAFMDAMTSYTMETMYAEFAKEGFSKEEADAAMEATYGMSTEAYVRQQLTMVDFNTLFDSLFDALGVGGVYYVENGQLYVGKTWDEEPELNTYTLEGDTLIIDSFSEEMGMDIVLNRITEE